MTLLVQTTTRMWADAQPDGRPVEYSLRPLLNAAVWLTLTARVPCNNAANIGERKIWTQSEFYSGRNSVRRQQPLPQNVYSVPSQETAKHRAKFGWEAMSCDWEGNRRSGVALAMRHRLKWFIHPRAQVLNEGDEHPTNTSLYLFSRHA